MCHAREVVGSVVFGAFLRTVHVASPTMSALIIIKKYIFKKKFWDCWYLNTFFKKNSGTAGIWAHFYVMAQQH